MKFAQLVLAFSLVFTAFAACTVQQGDNPTVEAAVKSFASVYCDKLKGCYADGFASAYPGGTQECVDKLVSSAASAKGAVSACTQAEVNACKVDVQNSACASTLDALTLPTSCKKC